MNIIVTLFFIITVFHTKYTQGFGDGVPECEVETTMDLSKRREALREHNFKRFYLAGGDPFLGRREGDFPSASDMNLLYYDCDMEYWAYDIAQGCHRGFPNFDYVGSNNATFDSRYFDYNYIKDAVESWWRTGLNYGPPVELAPSQENKPSIPFLQMANGGTNKLGCAFNICGDKDDPNSLAYVLFVCKYGEEQIQVGTPIYTDGPPCGSCEDRCYQTRLCKTQ